MPDETTQAGRRTLVALKTFLLYSIPPLFLELYFSTSVILSNLYNHFNKTVFPLIFLHLGYAL